MRIRHVAYLILSVRIAALVCLEPWMQHLRQPGGMLCFSVWRFPRTPPAGWLARVLLQKAGPAASSCLSFSYMSAPLARFGGCGCIDSLAFQAGLSVLH